jgi:hypothetical protein
VSEDAYPALRTPSRINKASDESGNEALPFCVAILLISYVKILESIRSHRSFCSSSIPVASAENEIALYYLFTRKILRTHSFLPISLEMPPSATYQTEPILDRIYISKPRVAPTFSSYHAVSDWPDQLVSDMSWTGSDFTDEQHFVYQLSDEERVEIETALSHFKSTSLLVLQK